MAVRNRQKVKDMHMDNVEREAIVQHHKTMQRAVPVYGQTDDTLFVQHRRINTASIEYFVDGWVTGRRGEGFGAMRYHRLPPADVAWLYGYKMAMGRKHYFSQALHSFLLSEEANVETVPA